MERPAERLATVPRSSNESGPPPKGTPLRKSLALYGAAVIAAGLVFAPAAQASGPSSGSGRTLFVSSAVEHPDDTVTLPLFHGTSRGRSVSFIVLDASTSNAASHYGVNRSNKLANAKGTAAVQRVSVSAAGIDFPASVDFTPQRQVVAGPTGFPPAVATPGAVGEPGYSSLIELPDGTILDAPQIANGSGQADKVVSFDPAAKTVTYRETKGFSRNQPVHYVSTEASDPAVAALEDVTFAPALAAAPFAGGDGTDSARAGLAAFVNGQTGATNPNRQGLNSALLDGFDPLNNLAWNPSQGRYSPVWDVFPAAWTGAAIATHRNLRQTAFADVADLAKNGLITGPGGAPFGPGGFVVICPIISQG